MKKKSSVVLLSAGLDSTVNLYAALRETDVNLAITFHYGQKAAEKEIQQSKMIALGAKVPHVVVDLPWLKKLGHSSLTHDDGVVPTGSLVAIENKKISEKTAKSVWVPNRNGVFLNVAAAYAENLNADMLVPGFNAEEAATFPDNSFDFIRATRKAFTFSTANQIDVQCYTISMSKIEIVELGKKMLVPFQMTWPCYLAEDKWCGACESCQRAKRAFKLGHVDLAGQFKI